MSRNGFGDPQYFFNRHFSWLQFNERVLEEARDPDNPVLERVKFLAITASNLDEFVEVRVAGLLQQVEHGNREPGPDGRVPSEVLGELSSKIHSFVKAQYSCWQGELVPALADESIRVLNLSALRPAARGISSRIRVRSVIGRFLEHSRIFIFGNGGKSEVYLGSADWMHRNIYERVEVMFHMRNADLCAQIFNEVIEPYLADTQKTRVLLPNGDYVHARDAHKLLSMRNGFHFNAQEFLIGIAEGREDIRSVPPAPRSMKLSPPRAPATKST